jgi:hypothetical protein
MPGPWGAAIPQAAFTTSSLSIGTHSITAVYGGDSTFSSRHGRGPKADFNKNPGRQENFGGHAEDAGYSFVLEESQCASIETSYSERRARDEIGNVGLLTE